MREKGYLKTKSIAMILIFLMIFQYISVIVPFLSFESIAEETETYYFTDSNNVTWSYELDEDENAINIKVYYSSSNYLYTDVPETLDGHIAKSLGDNAFGVKYIRNITIPNTIVSIGANAFYNKYISSITLPTSLKYLGDSCFEKCTNINSITIPASVEHIGDSCFRNCTSLTTITIPASVEYIGKNCFSDCSSLTAITVDSESTEYSSENGILYNKNKTTLKHYPYEISETAFTVPDTVTKIEEGAFNGNKIKDIIIPSSVTSIENGSFRNCTVLETITVSEDNEAYSSEDGVLFDKNKTKIIAYPCCKGSGYTTDKTYTIPDTVTEISDYAFYQCSLRTVTIPESVRTIGNYAYYEAYSIYTLELSDGLTSIGDYAFYDCRMNTLTIPSSVTTIGESAFFRNTNLSSVTIQDGVTSIGSKAFGNCTYLRSITIPGSVTSIEKEIFTGSTNLNTVILEDGVTNIKESAFSVCTGLTNITIPGSVRNIGDKAFYWCTGITSLEIPGGVESIGDSAFYYCYNITSLEIQDGVGSIGESAFESCTALTNITIPNSVTSIGSSAFKNCNSLNSVILSNNITKIEDSTFYGCNQLTNIEIPEGVTYIGDSAFYHCNNLSNIELPDSITKIEANAFNGCSKLTITKLPDNLQEIGDYAFSGCTQIKEMEIPAKVEKIGIGSLGDLKAINVVEENNYFSSEDGVLFNKDKTILIRYPELKIDEEYSIPEGVISISDNAFENCTYLNTVNIPSTIESIGAKAFYGCQSIQKIDIPRNVTSIGENLFSNTSTKIICYSNSEAHTYAVNNNYPYTFIDTVFDYELDENDNAIITGFNQNSLSVENVLIPEAIDGHSVVGIKENAFEYDEIIKTVTISKNIQNIADSAFYNCKNLESFNVVDDNNYYSSIDGILFNKNKTKLLEYIANRQDTTYTIPNGVEEIAENAFKDAKNLITINIPNSVNKINSYSFSGCSKLEKINVSEDNSTYLSEDGVVFNKAKTEIVKYPSAKKGNEYIVADSVSKILTDSFEACTNLKKITIPSTVENMEDSAIIIGDSYYSTFNVKIYCDEGSTAHNYAIDNNIEFVILNIMWKYDLDEEQNAINIRPNDPSLVSGDLVVPDTIDEHKVISIQEGAFAVISPNTSGLTGIVIPEGITSIKANTFDSCTNLKSVELPSTITTIETDAFARCTKLKNITLPEGITSIGDGAFQGSGLTNINLPNTLETIGNYSFINTHLTSVNIPSSVTTIGEAAFAECTNLEEINVDTENNNYTSEDGVLFNKDKTVLIQFPVGNKNIKEYIVPQEVITIGVGAFNSSKNLTNIILGQGVTTIEYNAFSNISGLTSIELPESVTSIKKGAFAYCYNLEKIIIPDSVTTIEDGLPGVFENCNTLTIYCNEGSTALEYAKSKNIPYKIVNMKWVYTIDEENNTCTIIKPNDSTLVSGDFDIPETIDGYKVVGIAEYAFADCENLTSVNIPKDIELIENRAFAGCTNLAKINVDDENNNYSSENGVLFNKDKTKLIKYPEGKCINSSSQVPGGPINIYNIPETVTTIGSYAFENVEAIGTIMISKNVTTIEESAISTCNNLYIVYIPNTVTNIGTNVLEGCNNVCVLCYENSAAHIYAEDNNINYELIGEIEWNYNLDENGNIIDLVPAVPSKLVGDIKIPETIDGHTVVSIGEGAFFGASYMTSLTIPSSITNIPDDVFGGCDALEKIIVSEENENYTSEDGILFNKDKTELIKYPSQKSDEEYIIPNTVKTIKIAAFESSNNLEYVELPNSVINIEDYAFYSCNNLNKIKIPDSVTNIGQDVFNNCSNLTIVGIPESTANIYATDNNIPFEIEESSPISISFEDNNLYEKIKENLQNKNIEIISNNQENNIFTIKIKYGDLLNITSLDISNANISNLSGIENFKNLTELNASKNKLENIVETEYIQNGFNTYIQTTCILDKLETLKKLDLSYNSLNNTSLRYVINHCYSLQELKLNNQTYTENIVSKVYYVYSLENLNSILLANGYQFANGESVDIETENCTIENEDYKKYIIFSDNINDTDTFAKVSVSGGYLDGSCITFKLVDSLTAEYKLRGNEFTPVIYRNEIYEDYNNQTGEMEEKIYKVKCEDAYLRYSIDGSDYQVYDDKIILEEGTHNIKLKIFDKLVLDTDIKIEESLSAIRKNGKVYIYTDSDETKYYSFEEEGTFEEYTEPVENSTAPKIYVKFDGKETRELVIINIDNRLISDAHIGTIIKEDDKSNYATRKNGIINMHTYFKNNKDIKLKGLYYSYDNSNWIPLDIPNYTYDSDDYSGWESKEIINNYEIPDIGTECIYLKEICRYKQYAAHYWIYSDHNTYYTLNLKPDDKVLEIIGIENNNGENIIFGEDIKYEKLDNEEKYKVINTENKIKKLNLNIETVTTAFEKIIGLGTNGEVYEITNEDGYEFTKITNGMNFKYIYGVFAIDEENNIWKCENNAGTLVYSKCTEFTIDGDIEKVYQYVRNNNVIPFVLYKDGRAVFLNEDGSVEEVSNQAIDISSSFYILEEKQIIDLKNDEIISLSDLLGNAEIPIKVNKEGEFLTDKLNLYAIDGKLLSSGVAKLGDYFYR